MGPVRTTEASGSRRKYVTLKLGVEFRDKLLEALRGTAEANADVWTLYFKLMNARVHGGNDRTRR